MIYKIDAHSPDFLRIKISFFYMLKTLTVYDTIIIHRTLRDDAIVI